jgi:hypothetical protein
MMHRWPMKTISTETLVKLLDTNPNRTRVIINACRLGYTQAEVMLALSEAVAEGLARWSGPNWLLTNKGGRVLRDLDEDARDWKHVQRRYMNDEQRAEADAWLDIKTRQHRIYVLEVDTNGGRGRVFKPSHLQWSRPDQEVIDFLDPPMTTLEALELIEDILTDDDDGEDTPEEIAEWDKEWLVMQIPKGYLPNTNMWESRPYGNSHEYTRTNCQRFGIPYLSVFEDIDTYIDERRGFMRMQGYLYNLHNVATWDAVEKAEELKFLGTLMAKAVWTSTSRMKTVGEIWNHTVYLPGYSEERELLEARATLEADKQ